MTFDGDTWKDELSKSLVELEKHIKMHEKATSNAFDAVADAPGETTTKRLEKSSEETS